MEKAGKSRKIIRLLNGRNIENNLTEGVCDVVLDYHSKSKKLLAIGHNVYYRNNRFLDTHGYFNKGEKSPHLQRFVVYSVKRQ